MKPFVRRARRSPRKRNLSAIPSACSAGGSTARLSNSELKAHFARSLEPFPHIDRPAEFRRVQEDEMEAVVARPANRFAHDPRRKPAASVIRFGEHRHEVRRRRAAPNRTRLGGHQPETSARHRFTRGSLEDQADELSALETGPSPPTVGRIRGVELAGGRDADVRPHAAPMTDEEREVTYGREPKAIGGHTPRIRTSGKKVGRTREDSCSRPGVSSVSCERSLSR